MRATSLLTSIFALMSITTAGPVNHKRGESKPGVDLANKGAKQQTFWFCENAANGDGWADPGVTGSGGSGCSKIVTSVVVEPSSTTAIVLDPTFKGRIARTTDTPATWVEVQIKANDGMAWGDVSLETGCDGAAEVSPTDGGQSHTVGFSEPADIVSKASQAPNVTETRADGVTVISIPWSGSQVMNQAAADFLKNNVKGGQKSAYITGTDGTDVAVSSNNRLAVTFY